MLAKNKDLASEGDGHMRLIILPLLEDRSNRIVRSVGTEDEPFVRVDEQELQLIKHIVLHGLKGQLWL